MSSLKEELVAAQKTAQEQEQKELEAKKDQSAQVTSQAKTAATPGVKKDKTGFKPQGEKKVDLNTLLGNKDFIKKLTELLGINDILSSLNETKDLGTKYEDLQLQILDIVKKISAEPSSMLPPQNIVDAIAKVALSNKKRVAKTSLKLDINTLLKFAGLPPI